MAKKIMVRRASDNKYLHKDFHNSMNYALNYLGEHYGDEGVKEYLSSFARSYHLPLIQDIRERGFDAIEDYLKKIYEAEEALDVLEIKRDSDSLDINIRQCPAVTHIVQSNIHPSPWFVETTKTIWATLAEESGLQFELISYNHTNGKAAYRFTRKMMTT
ncbi:MAG: hypothetical protein KBG64_08530 [Clostridia bacterium]|nr:hypothetical protein [Clostridia bacterium]